MPPKQQQSKSDVAKKQKVVEDKTFGLKNKNKSKNVQKYVQNLKQSVQPKPEAAKAALKVRVFFFPFTLINCRFSLVLIENFDLDWAEKEGGRES